MNEIGGLYVKYAVISGEYAYADEIQKHGYIPLKTAENPHLQRPVAYHADMNCAVINGTVYVAAEQAVLSRNIADLGYNAQTFFDLSPDYPHDVLLNFALCGKSAICNPKTIDKQILGTLKGGGYTIYPVNQGYAGCSALFVNEKAVITTDDGIYKQLRDKLDILKISPHGIALEGYDYGFIGGAAKLIDGDTMLFFGDVSQHPDYIKIERFLSKYGVRIKHTAGCLCDIGGMVIL